MRKGETMNIKTIRFYAKLCTHNTSFCIYPPKRRVQQEIKAKKNDMVEVTITRVGK